MQKNFKKKTIFILVLLLAVISTRSMSAMEQGSAKIQPLVSHQFFEEAKKNKNWKFAFATGQQEQIVFMNISPSTNPNNEIGMEVHEFDQVILIVEGKGNALLNGKASSVKEGDMIFIPMGTPHNVINLGGKKELKLISFYSQTDIPSGAAYKTKADQPED